MLFGECEQITTLSESEISELTTLISETDPFSAVNFHSDSPDEAEPAEIQTEYNFRQRASGTARSLRRHGGG